MKDDFGIDLGHFKTFVYARQQGGIVMRERSQVAYSPGSRTCVAAGAEARRRVGTSTNPLEILSIGLSGIDTYPEVIEFMLRCVLQTVDRGPAMEGGRILLAIPGNFTEKWKQELIQRAIRAGAGKADVVAKPWAAAIGAGIPVKKSTGHMVIDIGYATTELIVIANGAIVAGRTLGIGSGTIDETISHHMKRSYNMMIGTREEERIKLDVGSAYPGAIEASCTAKGRCRITGNNRDVTLTSTEIHQAIQGPVTIILDAILKTLAETSPDTAPGLPENGITLAGGGSLLKGFDHLIGERTRLPVRYATDPIATVTLGTGLLLEEVAN